MMNFIKEVLGLKSELMVDIKNDKRPYNEPIKLYYEIPITILDVEGKVLGQAKTLKYVYTLKDIGRVHDKKTVKDFGDVKISDINQDIMNEFRDFVLRNKMQHDVNRVDLTSLPFLKEKDFVTRDEMFIRSISTCVKLPKEISRFTDCRFDSGIIYEISTENHPVFISRPTVANDKSPMLTFKHNSEKLCYVIMNDQGNPGTPRTLYLYGEAFHLDGFYGNLITDSRMHNMFFENCHLNINSWFTNRRILSVSHTTFLGTTFRDIDFIGVTFSGVDFDENCRFENVLFKDCEFRNEKTNFVSINENNSYNLKFEDCQGMDRTNFIHHGSCTWFPKSHSLLIDGLFWNKHKAWEYATEIQAHPTGKITDEEIKFVADLRRVMILGEF